MKPRVWVFSTYDWCFICGVIILGGALFVIPFLSHNNQAIVYMIQKKYEKAEKKWLQALSKNSFSSYYRMNLALNYILLNQPEKAIQEYEVTKKFIAKAGISENFKIEKNKIKGSSSVDEEGKFDESASGGKGQYFHKEEILFYSFFNSAVAASQKEKTKDILDFYQQALTFRPHSLEVKTNIELLAKEGKSSSKQNQNESKSVKKKEEGSQESQSDKQKNNKSIKEKKEEAKKDKSEDKDETLGKSSGEPNKKRDKSQDSKRDDKQILNKTQKEAILKAILDQENKIRERRNQEEKRSTVIEKDW